MGLLLSIVPGLLIAAGWLLQATSFDRDAFLAIHSWADGLPWAWGAVTSLGSGLVGVLMCLTLGPRAAGLTAGVLLAVVFGGLLLQVFKLGLDVARPLAVLGPELVQPVGLALFTRSFPSGHAACAGALAALGGLALARAGTPGWRWRVVLLVGLAAAVALSRVVVGAHWPSDVLAGLGLGLAIGVLVGLCRPIRRVVEAMAASMRGRAGSRVMAGLAVLLAAMVWVSPDEGAGQPWLRALLCLVGAWGAVSWWRSVPGHRASAASRAATAAPRALSD